MGTGELNAGSNPSIPSSGGVEILSVASCYRNQAKFQPDGPLGSNADFTFVHYAFIFPLKCVSFETNANDLITVI